MNILMLLIEQAPIATAATTTVMGGVVTAVVRSKSNLERTVAAVNARLAADGAGQQGHQDEDAEHSDESQPEGSDQPRETPPAPQPVTTPTPAPRPAPRVQPRHQPVGAVASVTATIPASSTTTVRLGGFTMPAARATPPSGGQS